MSIGAPAVTASCCLSTQLAHCCMSAPAPLLCRAKFVTQVLAPLLMCDSELAKIVDFKYVAWGNAHNTTAQAR